MPSTNRNAPRHSDTILTHAGRHPRENHGFVNPPVYHASTVLFPDTAALAPGAQKYRYGRRGTPTSDALEEALRELEGAAGVRLAPSGMAALALALMSVTKAGDHVLVTDNAYAPTRQFADRVLTRHGVDVGYFDPSGKDFAARLRPNTAAVLLEAPGSLTFEMCDVPALAGAARAHGAVTIMDNTWASPLFCRPLALGVDLSVQAGTKYIVGHADVMLGAVAANARTLKGLVDTHGLLGLCVGPDDIYLGLRGLRTMGVRLRQHQASAYEIAAWLETRPEVARVRYPALPSDPGHAVWKRDFTGAAGLFACDFSKRFTAADRDRFVDALRLFGIGYSWGGFESLAVPVHLGGIRTVTEKPAAASVRLHIGLEDLRDLKADLTGAFAALENRKADDV